MKKETLEKLIADDTQGILDIDKKGVYRIYGRINSKRGGAFFGFTEQNEPVFGGGNLIHAPVWWNHSFKEVADICDKIMLRYPDCQAIPNRCDD